MYIYVYVLYIYCIWYVSFLHLFGGCYDSTMMGFPRIITPPTEMHRCGVRGLMAEGVRRGWDGCHYQNWKYSGQQGGSNKTADGQPTIIASKYPLDMEGCCFNIPQIATEINWVQGFDQSTHKWVSTQRTKTKRWQESGRNSRTCRDEGCYPAEFIHQVATIRRGECLDWLFIFFTTFFGTIPRCLPNNRNDGMYWYVIKTWINWIK